MTIEEDASLNGKGKKRNPFRRKQGGSIGEHGAAAASATENRTKLRWAQHLEDKDQISIEEGEQKTPKRHLRGIPPGNKLHWSPRLGRNKSHARGENNNDIPTENASREASREHPWNVNAKHHLGLHWSPKPGRKKDWDDVDEDAINERGSSQGDGDSGIPRQVGGSPAHTIEGNRDTILFHSRNSEVSDSISDSVSEASSTKEKVSDRIHRLRRKLNPRGKKAKWRYRLGEHRIDEEKVQHLPLGDELDPLEGFCHHRSLAGDLEVSEGSATVSKEMSRSSPTRQRSATEPNVSFAGYGGYEYKRFHSLECNTPPRSTQGASSENEINTLRSGHSSLVSGIVSQSDKNGRSSDVISLGAAPGYLQEESPLRTPSKSGENKEFRVKPFHRFDPPVFMTESEIHEFMLQPSQKVEFLESFIAPSTNRTKKIKVSGETERIWGSTDDGRVGSLRVEVLGCIGLASVKPDVSAYLICGDVPFVTDVIPSCRSPRWPPTCKRAAVFPVHHAYARLFAGVFASKKDKANDEFCGRVVIDLAALRPNTEYDVTLPIRASSFIYDRRPRGVIRLRFSLHWFSERAAVWSYLQSPHSVVTTPIGDNPSILCGDPKTFRNVAITVHGQDLPGKFTRKAFQATMREFNLTRLNLIFLAKTLATDAVLYQKPLVSFYIFVTWMRCVYTDSVKLAPAYFIGYLIICLFSMYENFNQDQARYLGFAPPTLQELIYAMVSRTEQQNVRPILVEKVSVYPRQNLLEQQQSGLTYGFSQDFSGDILPLDHREFPFSEKLEYPRFRPEDAIASAKHMDLSSATAPDQYLYGRLSVLASSAGEKMSNLPSVLPSVKSDEDVDDVWELSDEEDLNDSDHLRDDGDNVFMQSDDEADEDEGFVNTGTPIVEGRRIPIGPPQDCDVKPVKRVPPQVMLARAENMLHRLTFGLFSMDKVFQTSVAVGKRLSGVKASQECLTGEMDEASNGRGRRKKSLLDDFDKRLGLSTRSKNPVVGITSSFLGPIMRMFRIFLVATRVVFNIGVWKDPFLSFWVLCFLIVLMFILLIFPWRSFMFLAGLICFGPQNILVRRSLIRRAAAVEKEQQQIGSPDEGATDNDASTTGPTEDDTSTVRSETSSDGTSGDRPESVAPDATVSKDDNGTKVGRRQRLKSKLASMKGKRRLKKQESRESQTRPAFRGATYHKASKVPSEPREVVVPYTRVRTERFYDWPPDPTVSRASPVFLTNNGFIEESLIPCPSVGPSSSPRSIIRRRASSEI